MCGMKTALTWYVETGECMYGETEVCVIILLGAMQ